MIEVVENPANARKRIAEHIEAILAGAKRPKKARDVRTVAQNVERGIFNYSVRDTNENKNCVAQWSQPRFVYVYLARLRAICRNLEANKNLLKTVSNEQISADRLSRMSVHDFAPEKWGRIFEEIRVRKQHVQQAVATTSLYECGQCGSAQISHDSRQIRSADEGESVFFRCLSCNHEWREI